MKTNTMQIANIQIGQGNPLAIIAGLNVLQDLAPAIACAERVQEIAQKNDLPLIFKASFDKANRTRVDAFRGPGLKQGLEILTAIKKHTGLPIITDIHTNEQAAHAARVVDALQIPAMLCRQTDLLQACAATGKPINIKKGQFIAPADLEHAVKKIKHFGGHQVLVTERGTSFGYGDLVVDMRSLLRMQEFSAVCFDATHSVQRPGQRDGASGGERKFVAPLARAAVAFGVDALFLEVHENPEDAPVDGPCQLTFGDLDALLSEVHSLRSVLKPRFEE
ncbi:MAG: 3-deoxy-8-phosphooctulonate synthase [Deltaproteobacteria bacterium]|nr:3-deoxy-8-phosphooctulonate synthase [Deltaproteobacteria bacterium]